MEICEPAICVLECACIYIYIYRDAVYISIRTLHLCMLSLFVLHEVGQLWHLRSHGFALEGRDISYPLNGNPTQY